MWSDHLNIPSGSFSLLILKSSNKDNETQEEKQYLQGNLWHTAVFSFKAFYVATESGSV